MANKPASLLKRRPSIRFSRTMSLSSAIAANSSIAIGLGIFILVGSLLQQASAQTPWAYLVMIGLFLPLVLTYAERAAVTTGSGGAFTLVRATGSTWRTYTGGWLLLGGHLALIALLAWGAALYLHTALDYLLNVSIATIWLAPAMVFIVALNDLLGTRGGWQLRKSIVYGSIALLIFIVARAIVLPAPLPVQEMADPVETWAVVRLVALLAASLWGINFVLDRRDEMRQPARTILPALLIPMIGSGVLGAVIAAIELQHINVANLVPQHTSPLTVLTIHASFAGETMLESIVVTMGFMVSLVALDRTMVSMLHLVGVMVRDGFLSEQFSRISPGFRTPLFALRLFAIVGALFAALVPTQILVGLVAQAFLWTTVLFSISDVLGGRPRMPADRPLRLPFDPLFPVLTTAICIFLATALPPVVILVGAGWLLLGVFYYVRYARQGGIAVRKRDAVVGEVLPEDRKAVYTILVCIANPDTAPALIRAGLMLARARKGQVLVLKVAVFPDQMPHYLQRQEAQEQLRQLQATTDSIRAHDIPMEALVRLAHSPVDGILGTAQEEKVDLLVLGWEGESSYGRFDLGPLLDPVVRMASRDVVVVRGEMPDRLCRVLVPTADSPNSLAALQLARDLVDGNTEAGYILALNLVQEVFSPNSMDDANKRLQEIINRLGNTLPIEGRVDVTDDVTTAILNEASDFDMLMLGASRGGMLDQAIFGGLPVEVAQQSPRPVLLVKHYEGARRFWFRRAWETLSAPFPSLTIFERTEIEKQMRRSSHPSVDFFIMIGLAGSIATLGLLLNSPAVIIGAMLVAPLMSPILAIAMSIVLGDLLLLRLAARVTLSGIVLALGMSIAITFITPTSINTSEILARTQPNLLDLLVALASGAAGGYAMGRKEVAAALPGVAIAAALVPPLGVIGYGTATGQLDIAGGSLLLFSTNLIAIVVAAAVVFLLLGFRPPRARLRGQVRAKLLISLLALLLISIPLASFSVSAIDQITSQREVETILSDAVESDTTMITEVLVERQEEGFLVLATIYATEDLAPNYIAELETHLSNQVGEPVTLHATVLRAMLLPEEDETLPPTPTPML